jgi:hypothetical protein
MYDTGMNRFAFLGLLAVSVPALPCTCVSAAGSTAKTMVKDYAVVFRGTVVERELLPQRVEMKGRRRFSITFRVGEYWKGSPDRMRILYGVDNGTDCMGDGGYEVGRNYLVYAGDQVVKDVILDNAFFWFGWTDVLPEGTHMLVPRACAPGGETTTVEARTALRELGRARTPQTINH